MTKEERKRIVDTIAELEYCANGLRHLSCGGVKVVNLLTTRKDVYVYDCILYGDNESHRYNDCEMPKSRVAEYMQKAKGLK